MMSSSDSRSPGGTRTGIMPVRAAYHNALLLGPLLPSLLPASQGAVPPQAGRVDHESLPATLSTSGVPPRNFPRIGNFPPPFPPENHPNIQKLPKQ